MKPDHARLKCYAEMQEVMRLRMEKYYRRHENLMGDDRSRQAVRESTEGMREIFSVLDKYDIQLRDEK